MNMLCIKKKQNLTTSSDGPVTSATSCPAPDMIGLSVVILGRIVLIWQAFS